MTYPYKNGFTLIELVVVLLIAGVALSIVGASLHTAYEKNVLRQEVIRLQNTLRHARELSLLQRTPFAFALEEESGTYWLEKNDAVHGNVKEMPRSTSISGERIVFLPRGNSTGGSVTVLDDRNRGYSIAVDPVTGAARARRL